MGYNTKKFKHRVFEVLDLALEKDRLSKFIDIFIISLICLNVIFVILGTVKSFHSKHQWFLDFFELFSVIIFTIEYILRLWVCTENKKYSRSILGRIKYIFTPGALIDLIAILPYYLPIFVGFDLRFIRVLRLLRLLRLLKLGRYSEAIKLFGRVFIKKREELFMTVFLLFILLIFASSLMYYIENQAQPEHFSSIISAMWWAIATLTTVGYGDVYPITIFGKILGAFIAVLGIGMFALPAGIISSGFSEEIKRKEKILCPFCKKNIKIE